MKENARMLICNVYKHVTPSTTMLKSMFNTLLYIFKCVKYKFEKVVFLYYNSTNKKNANTDNFLDRLSGKARQKYSILEILFSFKPKQKISTASPRHRVCH